MRIDVEDNDRQVSEADQRLAARLVGLRTEHGWSLEELALKSGISRATLSRIERGTNSPTAALLGRLCAAYGRTMSRLLAEVEGDGPQLVDAAGQSLWKDPETGFVRRSASPPAAGYSTEMVVGHLPAGAAIAYAFSPIPGLEHHLLLLSGRLDLRVGDETYELSAGDCLRYRLFSGCAFKAPGPDAAHYVLAVTKP